MAIFDAVNAAGSGMSAYRTWIDAISHNVANVNTVQPTSGNAFQAEYVQVQAVQNGSGEVGGGVAVTNIALGSAQGVVTHDPQNPLADAQGDVRRPDIDMGEQMGNLIMAQRGFQANAAVVDRARESYQSAIDIGKKV
jgi:flagellar basal-body rod protein FlgC